MKEKTDDIAGGEQSSNRIVGRVEHLRLRVDLQAAESECDAAGDGIGPVGRLIDRVGPVGFLRRDAFRAAPV